MPTHSDTPSSWRIFQGKNQADPGAIERLPPPPPWRELSEQAVNEKGSKYQFAKDSDAIDLINTALYLRRPLLVTGKPGTGKSSLAYAVAHELGLGSVLTWNINSRSTLQEGLYQYDAMSYLREITARRAEHGIDSAANLPIGDYIRLGPLGTAFQPRSSDGPSVSRPRVLLIDEIDKSDIDLPNDLLNILEECSFEIPEITRLPHSQRDAAIEVATADPDGKATIKAGKVTPGTIPFVVMTSNDEREFPPAFLRRCITLRTVPPDKNMLVQIVQERLSINVGEQTPPIQQLIEDFIRDRNAGSGTGATDHLLNAIYLAINKVPVAERAALRQAILRGSHPDV